MFFLHSGLACSQKRESIQQPLYNITTEHGLPSLETYSVKQDSKGYIWFCTDAGVCRYDGYEYRNFTVKDGLTDNVVFDTYEDIKGRVWFLTYNSELCYFKNDKIIPYKFNDKIRNELNEKISTQKEIWIDNNENLFYELFENGILKITKNGEVTKISPGKNEVFLHEVEGEKVLSYIYSNGGSIYKKLISVDQNGTKQLIDSNVLTFRYSYPKDKENINHRYFIFGNKLYDLHQRKILLESSGLLELTIKDSIFYISTLNGLLRRKLENDQLKILPTILPNEAVSGVYFDNSNGVWISTLNAGVYYTYSITALDEKNFSKNNSFGDISSIGKLNNKIVIGTFNGIIRGEKQPILLDDKFPLSGSVKLASIKNRLFISNSTVYNFQCYTGKYGNVFYNWASNLISKNERIYLVHHSKVMMFEMRNGKNHLKELYNGVSDSSKNKKVRLLAITITNKNEIIVATKNQLFYVKNKRLVPINFPQIDKTDISYIHYDENWGIIVGTRGHGLFFLKDRKQIHFEESDGLLSNHINTLAVGRNGIVYIGTTNGLSMINQALKISNFNKNYTLEGVDINVIYCDESELYLGTKTGLIKISYRLLNECFTKNSTGKISLKSIKVDQHLVKCKSNIDFPSDATHLLLSFSVFQFNNWLNKKFQYKIGENGQWIDIESPTVSLYRPNGNFDIYVRYLDVQNNWSEATMICNINVIVPFWKRWYFWVGIAFCGLILIFFIFQRNQRRKINKLIYESNMLSLEQQMQNARMNPHFIFNVLNSIHSYVLKEETAKADVYLMKFSKLMREILFSTKEGKIAVQHETSILTKYLELEQLRFNQSFDFEVIFREEMLGSMIPSMMIQPFVENAVLYSIQLENEPKMKITVHFEQLSISTLKVSISNSGIPTPEAQAKIKKVNTKNAIGITRKRLENYNKLFNSSDYGIELFVNDEKLTVIELKIPIVKK